MSIYNCYKQQPQPWMSYISDKNICYTGSCCSLLITDTTSLLPFQIISNGAFQKMEVSPYGENDYQEIAIPYTEVFIEGFYFISYNGATLDLECGAYNFKLTAGEVWYFEPITVRNFTITENAFQIHDDLMLPFKFSEQQFETTPLIAPCDSFLPFMFSTENATLSPATAPIVYLYDVNDDCDVTELTDIIVTVLTISGKTYYIHEGECFYPFLECGTYKLEIVDGTHSYFSVPFDAICGMNDIPDGYRVMRDFNGCVMRDETGEIMYSDCTSALSWTFVSDGFVVYRKGIRDGNYVIDFSEDGGVTWELDLVVLAPDEDSIIINIDDGVAGYRQRVVGRNYYIDHELTPTGFAGDEDTDWEYIYKIEK